jgi:integrative and conjugative element protein (TIGR02256 family)
MLSYSIGSSGQSICFTTDVLAHFRKYQQTRWYHCEAGGQLFAIKEEARIVVIEVTGPRKTDRRTRTSYVPDRRLEMSEIAEQEQMSRFFVGDWHTHPQPIAKPSPPDLQSIQECFRDSVHVLNGFVLVIVGTAKFPEGLFVSVSDGENTHELAIE